MRLVKEIEFQAKTENEAYARAREKLGPDGVILSIQTIRATSFFGKKKLVVRAGILEESNRHKENEANNLEQDKRQMEIFKALLEYKQSLKDFKACSTDTQKITEGIRDSIELVGKGEIVSHPANGGRSQTAVICDSARADDERNNCRTVSSDAEAENFSLKLWREYEATAMPGVLFRDWVTEKGSDFCFTPGGDVFLDALGGRRIMVVGPTGVGKTTTIAKIAAIAVQEDREIALFTSDNYRVSAVEQIRTFARVLDVPLEVVNAASEIPALSEKYTDDTLLLMDTAGCGFRETERMSHIEKVCRFFRPDAVHMAVSANARFQDVRTAIGKTMESIPISRIILTKTDETTNMEGFLGVPMTFGLPFSFITTGQNVPRDIDYATAEYLAERLSGEGAGI